MTERTRIPVLGLPLGVVVVVGWMCSCGPLPACSKAESEASKEVEIATVRWQMQDRQKCLVLTKELVSPPWVRSQHSIYPQLACFQLKRYAEVDGRRDASPEAVVWRASVRFMRGLYPHPVWAFALASDTNSAWIYVTRLTSTSRLVQIQVFRVDPARSSRTLLPQFGEKETDAIIAEQHGEAPVGQFVIPLRINENPFLKVAASIRGAELRMRAEGTRPPACFIFDIEADKWSRIACEDLDLRSSGSLESLESTLEK
jgi:hypothetical protein